MILSVYYITHNHDFKRFKPCRYVTDHPNSSLPALD